MKNQLNDTQIQQYQDQGFLIVEDFLSRDELEVWRQEVQKAVDSRAGNKLPDRERVGDELEPEYYDRVFAQVMNLWQDNPSVKELITDERIRNMAAQLAGVEGTQLYQDQALIKKPWANPTGFHLDNPYWSFTNRQSISIWIALDDATPENGCMVFLPGTHKVTDDRHPGISKNMDAIFEIYPEFRNVKPVCGAMKAGSCSFHNGYLIHAAGANLTNGYRRAMTAAFMPEGSTFNGTKNFMSDELFASLKPGDLLPAVAGTAYRPQLAEV